MTLWSEEGRTCAADVDDDGLDEGALGELLDLAGHRGGEEQRLPLPVEEGEDRADVLLESHVWAIAI